MALTLPKRTCLLWSSILTSYDLEIPDDSHVKKVCDALWTGPHSRASVMVGSGFSRNARNERGNGRQPPLWEDIAGELNRSLYPGLAANGRKSGSPGTLTAGSALRLAQEYKTAFGRTDLHRLLADTVADNHFSPSDTHRILLNLPWRDVFTTNWDTLLERTSLGITDRTYSIVQDADQIPLLGQPRIFKLHGSLPASYPLIVTEEDYRRYPIEYAPFVNTVQQAMMETVFLLIGFSGDDPNFLEWSGWVRDNLGEATPKIYLAGYLELSPHRRLMLEENGVVSIDIANHPEAQRWPEHLKQQYSVQWLLHTLHASEPYDESKWPVPPKLKHTNVPSHLLPIPAFITGGSEDHPKSENRPDSRQVGNETREEIIETGKIWAHNRGLYPGWLVLPSGAARSEFKWRTDDWELSIISGLQDLDPVERLEVLRELLWRREILLEPISVQFQKAAVDALALVDCERRTIEGLQKTQVDWSEIRDSWRTIAMALARDARFEVDEPEFETWLGALEQFSGDTPDVAHEIHHERCLWAIYSLDFDGLNNLLDSWRVEESDPMWMLRKAALLTEIGRLDAPKSLIQTSLGQIQRNLIEERNVANASRYGWALGSTQTWENRQEILRRWDELASLRCDAGTEMDTLARLIQANEERQDAPSFDLGTRQSSTIHFSTQGQARLIGAYRAVRLPEVAGLPPVNSPDEGGFIPISAASGILGLAADQLVESNPQLAMRLALRICRNDRDDTLQRVFSRTHIATLETDAATTIARLCTKVIEHALPRLSIPDNAGGSISWIERMQVSLEVLSRLVLRLPPVNVNDALELGFVCYKTPQVVQHSLLAAPLVRLLERSWIALPRYERVKRVFDVLSLPISGFEGFSADIELTYPGTFILEDDLPEEREVNNEPRFRELIDFLIRALRAGEDVRGRAILRLLPFLLSESLTSSELEEIGEALWDGADPVTSNSSGPGSALDWVYILFPAPESGRAVESFRRKWLAPLPGDQDGESTYSSDMLRQVGTAVSALSSHERSLCLKNEDEEHIIGQITRVVDMLASGSVRMNLAFGPTVNGISTLAVGVTLPDEVASSLFERARAFVSEPESTRRSIFTMVAQARLAIGFALIPGLIKALPSRLEEFTSWIKAGLASRDRFRASRAMSALQLWLSKETSAPLPPVPGELLREVSAVIGYRHRDGLDDALRLAISIFDQGTTEHQDAIRFSVLEGLAELAADLSYSGGIYEADTISTLRILCVRLAITMSRAGYDGEPAVEEWLEIGASDPFAEGRNLVNLFRAKQCPGGSDHGE